MANINFPGILHKRKQDVLQIWTNHQMEDPALRDDLMTNEELRNQSEELLDVFEQAIRTGNYEDLPP